MAPGQEQPTSTTVYPYLSLSPNMSSPNSKAYTFVAKGRSQDAPSPASEFTTLSIGRDSHQIPIAKIASLGKPAWEKNACFRRLAHAIRGQLQSHSISDLITAVTSQLPIDTNAAFEEAMTVQDKVQAAATNLDFIQPVGFLDAHGKPLDPPSSMDIADRPAGISYVHLACTLHANKIDPNISQPPLSFDFCLKLHQSRRDNSTGEISALNASNVAMKVDNTSPKKKSSGLFGSRTIVNAVVDVTKAKTGRLFGGSGISSDTTISWFGEAEFLDDASVFTNEFGQAPIDLLPVPPVHSSEDNFSNSVDRKLRRYAERCMFDVFLQLCKADYVGIETDAGDILAVQAVCQNILDLKQQYRNSHGKTDVRSPEELHNLYLRLIPSLPSDPQEWTIPLSATYFNALIDELRSKMLSASFRVPKPCAESTKSAELASLRQVRNVATEHFNKLQEEVALMDRFLGSRSGPSKHGQSLIGKAFFHVAEAEQSHHPSLPPPPPPQPAPQTAQIFYHSTSPAEQTLQRYTAPPSNTTQNGPPNPLNLPTRPGPTGLPHPFRQDDPTYLSRFPLGFRGCFKCGSQDHNSWKDCPHQRNGGNKREFFRELWIHKPHLKRSDFSRPPTQPPQPQQSVRISTKYQLFHPVVSKSSSASHDSFDCLHAMIFEIHNPSPSCHVA